MYVENFPTKKPRWIPGTVITVTSYEVELESGARVYVDSVRSRQERGIEERQNSDQESHPPMLLGPQISSETDDPPLTENPGNVEPGPDPNAPP